MARPMYGTGMRLMECMTLWVKDVDFVWIFPSDHESTDPRSRIRRQHQNHMYEQTFQRAIKRAAESAKLTKRGSHTFRYSFATHLLESGYDIRTVRELFSRSDVSTDHESSFRSLQRQAMQTQEG